MFDGKVRGNRAVSSAGKKRESDKGAFMENTRKQREDRAAERKKLSAVVRLQSFAKRYIVRKAVTSRFKLEMDRKVSGIVSIQSAFRLRGSQFNVPLDVLLPVFRSFLFTFDGDGAQQATAADIIRLKRLSAVLRLFLDSLRVKTAGAFNPFLAAIMEGVTDSRTSSSSHRSWEYMVLELTRISVNLIGTFFDLQSMNDINAMGSTELSATVEIACEVLHTILQWQSQSQSQNTNDATQYTSATATVTSTAIGTLTSVFTSDSDPNSMVCDSDVMQSNCNNNNDNKDVIDADILVCSISRYISKSCNRSLRSCIMLNQRTDNNRTYTSNTSTNSNSNSSSSSSKNISSDNSLSSRATSLLLMFIQTSIRSVMIQSARFRVSRDQNVSTYSRTHYCTSSINS